MFCQMLKAFETTADPFNDQLKQLLNSGFFIEEN